MKSQSIPLREANQNFSRIIAAVEQGEAFSITRRGREVARLLPALPDGVPPGARGSSVSASPHEEPTLAERVLRLETQLDKLVQTLSARGHREK